MSFTDVISADFLLCCQGPVEIVAKRPHVEKLVYPNVYHSTTPCLVID